MERLANWFSNRVRAMVAVSVDPGRTGSSSSSRCRAGCAAARAASSFSSAAVTRSVDKDRTPSDGRAFARRYPRRSESKLCSRGGRCRVERTLIRKATARTEKLEPLAGTATQTHNAKGVTRLGFAEVTPFQTRGQGLPRAVFGRPMRGCESSWWPQATCEPACRSLAGVPSARALEAARSKPRSSPKDQTQ